MSRVGEAEVLEGGAVGRVCEGWLVGVFIVRVGEGRTMIPDGDFEEYAAQREPDFFAPFFLYVSEVFQPGGDLAAEEG